MQTGLTKAGGRVEDLPHKPKSHTEVMVSSEWSSWEVAERTALDGRSGLLLQAVNLMKSMISRTKQQVMTGFN